jgi:DNA-binding MarR family transcriptional regulator
MSPRKQTASDASGASSHRRSQPRRDCSDISPDPRSIKISKLDKFLSFHLRRTRNELSRRYSEAIADTSLPLGGLSSLAAIVEHPGISQADLGQKIGINKSTAVTIVNELERSGLAERRSSVDDRRRHALHPTAAGISKLNEWLNDLASMEAEAMSVLSSDEQLVLINMLRRLYEGMVVDRKAQ